MKRKFNLFKNKALIVVIIGILIFSSVGFVLAYNKIAQISQNPPENITADGNDQDENFEIGKFFQNIPAGSYRQNGVLYTQKGSSPLDLQISFKGKIDINPDLAYVDVMLLIDRSNSMKENVGSLGEEVCQFTGFDPDSNKNEENYVPYADLWKYDNSKMCWAERAAREFINLAGNDKGRLKIGYVTYGNEDKTKREINPQYFKPLTDTWGDSRNRDEIKNWIKQIGFHSGYSGTAMAKATDIALEELKNNGRDTVDGKRVEKYIIILTDGIGGMQSGYNYQRSDLSAMTGCMSFRDSPTDTWPSNYPQVIKPCQVPAGYPGVRLSFPFAPEYNDCCITGGVNEAFKSNGINRPISTFDYNKSPVGILLNRNIKAPTIGFAESDNRINKQLLQNIATQSHNDGNKHYYFSESPEDIIDAFRDIFYSMFDKGASINFEETLPPGVDIDINNIEILRNVVDPVYCNPKNRCRKPYDSNEIKVTKSLVNGRVVLSFEIASGNYDDTISFDKETFIVRLNNLNTNGASAGAFDIDQNRDCECKGEPCSASEPVSSVEWRFKWPRDGGGQYVRSKMPKLCVNFRASQYTGDVYGAGINNYLFPYIDVLVSNRTIAPGTQAVWELPNYNFSATSFSNFSNYQTYLGSQIEDLKQKAKSAGSISDALQSGFNQDVYPEGRIFYIAKGQGQILNNSALIKGRRTIIVDDDLTIDANIIKANKESTAAIIVLGKVIIAGGSSEKSIQAGIITPGKDINGLDTQGLISIEGSRNYLNILGFLIGKRVSLKGAATADFQSINYDPDLAKYPPPGLSKLSLPFYQEVAP